MNKIYKLFHGSLAYIREVLVVLFAIVRTKWFTGSFAFFFIPPASLLYIAIILPELAYAAEAMMAVIAFAFVLALATTLLEQEGDLVQVLKEHRLAYVEGEEKMVAFFNPYGILPFLAYLLPIILATVLFLPFVLHQYAITGAWAQGAFEAPYALAFFYENAPLLGFLVQLILCSAGLRWWYVHTAKQSKEELKDENMQVAKAIAWAYNELLAKGEIVIRCSDQEETEKHLPYGPPLIPA